MARVGAKGVVRAERTPRAATAPNAAPNPTTPPDHHHWCNIRANILCDRQDVIQSGGRGYRLAKPPWQRSGCPNGPKSS